MTMPALRPNDTANPPLERKWVAESLAKLLADTYVLFTKTQSFHWNVTGPHFFGLHAAFEKQYTELVEALDEIAERIRALGFWAPGASGDLARFATVREVGGVPASEEMVRQLLLDQETIIASARAALATAEAAHDVATADLVTRRIAVHEKTAWMLRSQSS
jgi:starvation-inducible DNA-binding protein